MENSCFAKTFGLDPRLEPSIHGVVCRRGAYIENVSQDDAGHVDFFDTSHTPNGRAVLRMDALGAHRDAGEIPPASHLLILNRNENIIPIVTHLSRQQAALYFMLGETQGTSAGDKDEEGKFLRMPGTNPFFPSLHSQQGNRFLDLLDASDIQVPLLNTGRIGGPAGDERSKKVEIPHSSVVVKAIAEGTIGWERDANFGYEVGTAVPGVHDPELMQPRRLHARQGREQEYRDIVGRLKQERRDYLTRFPGLRDEIAAEAS